MEFYSFLFHFLFFGLIFQLSNTIVSSTKVEIPAQNEPTDMLDSFTGQVDEKDTDIGKRLVQQRIKRDTDDDTDYDTADDEPIPEDVVYIDHRQWRCLGEIKDQGDCRASYAFATIAFYEWLFCKKNRRFHALSEQYIIDCGHLRGNSGCDGGTPAKAIMFSRDCGLLLQAEYLYTGTQGSCPYPVGIHSRNMGSLRINQPSPTYIPISQLAEYLQYGPIIVTIEITNRFFSYTGGVDDNLGHTPRLLHTMLLIGHGRENGKEYWLFRNSNSATFGGNELGHYKLNKNVICFVDGHGLGLGGPLPE